MDPSEPHRPDDETLARALLESAGPRPELPQADLEAIRGAARFAWRVRRRRARRARLGWALAAGVGALALGLALLRSRPDSGPILIVADVDAVHGVVELAARPIAVGEALPAGSRLASGGLGRASVRLRGGATVRLDEETRVRFVAADVLDLDQGAVYVDTGAGTGRAARLAVRTPLGTAHDVGTQFSVRFDAAATRLTVAVRAGAVEVEQSGRSHRAPAGEEIVLAESGLAARRPAPVDDDSWAWVWSAAPPFEIEGRTLGEFLDQLGRETGWRVRFADEAQAAQARAIVLHGGVPAAQRPEQVLDSVLAGSGLAAEIEDGVVVVRPAGAP